MPRDDIASRRAISEFTRALYGNVSSGYVECRALPSKQRVFCWAPDGPTRIVQFVQEQRSDNCYVGVATRHRDTSGDLGNCHQLTALYTDLDFKDLPEAAARARLAAFPFPPSLLVQSGGGLHGYWLLREPLELPNEESLAKDALRRLALHLGGDLQAAECARILRVPGTFNYKYKPPAAVTLERCDPECRYNVSELVDFLPPDTPSEPAPRFSLPSVIEAGHRNDLLFRAGRSLKGKALSASAVLAALGVENATRCQPPLDEAEVRAIVDSVFSQPDRPGYEPRPPGPPRSTSGVGPEGAAPEERLTDLGNARRLARLAGEDLRYVHAWNHWLIFTGTHWTRDQTGAVERYAKHVVEALHLEAAAEPNQERRKALGKHAVLSDSARAIRNMITLAQSEVAIAISPEALDRDLWLLNCQNGTLELRTGTLRAHQRKDLITKCVPVAYEPTAPCSRWEAFLGRIFADRGPLIAFLQRALGYSLTGETREQALFLCWGAGANGKSTLMQTVRTLLADYGGELASSTLLAKKHDATAEMNDLGTLQGARFVMTAESDMGRSLAEALVKQLTGGEAIKVKKLYADVYPITPTFKLWIATNHKPVIRGTDHAIWRRIRLIPFDTTIPSAEQDPFLLERLQAERPGILRWMVEGCLAWQTDRLGLPEEVKQATASYRLDMDALEGFLSERVIRDPQESVGAGELHDAYTAWAKDAGESALTLRPFGRQLEERGLRREKTKTGRKWLGMRLRTPMDLAEQPPGDGLEPLVTEVTAVRINPPREAAKESFPEMPSPSVTRHPDPSPPDDELPF